MSASIASQKGFYGWVNLAVTAAMGVVGGLYLISFSYFLPFFVEDFGWNRGTASLAATINMVVMGVCGPLAGIFVVKYGARRAMVLGNALGCGAFLLLSMQDHLWELFLGYGVLVGIGAGFGGLLASTTVLNNWFVKRRSLVLGIFLGSGGLGGIFMGPALMALITTRGWRFTYVCMSLLVLLVSVIVPACLVRNRPQDLGQLPDGPAGGGSGTQSRPAPKKASVATTVDFTLREAMRTPCFWCIIAYFCMNMFAMGMLMTHMIAHLFDLGIEAAVAAVALSVMSGVMTFAQFGAGFVGMRYSILSIAITGEALKITGVVILLFTATLPFVFVAMVILGVGFGSVMVATFNIFPNYFGLSDYPKIMGYARLFWAIVGGAGAPLAGYIRDTSGSYLPAFQIALAILVAGLVCLVFAKAPVHPSLKKTKPVEAVVGRI